MSRSVRHLAFLAAVLGVSVIAYSIDASLSLIAIVFLASAHLRLEIPGGQDLSLLPGAVFGALIFQFSVLEITVAVAAVFATTWLRGLSHDCTARSSGLLLTASSALMVGLWVLVDLVTNGSLSTGSSENLNDAGLLIALVAVLWGAVSLLLQVWLLRSDGRKYLHRLSMHLRKVPLELVILSAAATLAAMWPQSPFWAVAISFGSFGVTYGLLMSIVAAKRIEALTIRAIGRLPEAAGLSPAGHATDVARLSVGIGVIQGLSDDSIRGLERAGTLHDIGLLCYGRNADQEGGYSEAEKTNWGAEIVGSSKALGEEAETIPHIWAPYRAPGFDPDSSADPKSQIIRAACAFHTLLAAGVDTEQAVESLYSERFVHAPWAVQSIRPAIELDSSPGPGRRDR